MLLKACLNQSDINDGNENSVIYTPSKSSKLWITLFISWCNTKAANV